uniref:Uncharacterized protein n=1 Tax=Oryza rufipogon TaxID=4529 RepID=A0A0E0PU46_ORYRU
MVLAKKKKRRQSQSNIRDSKLLQKYTVDLAQPLHESDMGVTSRAQQGSNISLKPQKREAKKRSGLGRLTNSLKFSA